MVLDYCDAGDQYDDERWVTHEDCAEAEWAVVVRTIEAYPDRFPENLLKAVKICRTTPEEKEWCSGTLMPMYLDYNRYPT